MSLCFEDVALALRRADAKGVHAAFVVDRDFSLGDAHPGASFAEGQRITSESLPSILGWVAVGLPLRHA